MSGQDEKNIKIAPKQSLRVGVVVVVVVGVLVIVVLVVVVNSSSLARSPLLPAGVGGYRYVG